MRPPAKLVRLGLPVDGVVRTYWVSDASPSNGPLLLVFHGLGINGPTMAAWTGLAERGPAAGFVTVFPEGVREAWDDTGVGRTDGIDDARFISALVLHLEKEHSAPDDVFLIGLSNGAFFAEYLARHGVIPVRGIVLVAGTSRESSRQRRTQPAQRSAVLMIVGTDDPNVPYAGGRASGVTGWIARRRMSKLLRDSDGREAVAPETIAADWAAADGCQAAHTLVSAAEPAGDLAIEKLSWSPCHEGRVELYRIVGGGHGWPGGPQYVPRSLIGRVSKSFDATGLLLRFAQNPDAQSLD